MDEKKAKALDRVREEIARIDKNENKIYFFVIDTKGNPSGSLEYIYNLALMAKKNGYNVAMLHQEEEFVGVGEWLGEEYSSIDHFNVAKDSVEVTPSDVLFIPEIFATVMNQTKKLPCKRIAILQNYDFMVEQMQLSVQWGDFGIMEAVTNTEYNAQLLKDVFPYVKSTVIEPFISKKFGTTSAPKDMVVNIVAKDPEDVNRIVKPFYWKYPSFKWVSFKDLRGQTKEQFAENLRNGAVTVWIDESASFGYAPLEAMKSGSIVIAKVPDSPLKWSLTDDKESPKLKNCCVWFDDIHNVHKQIASVVRSWITDKVPSEIFDASKEAVSLYSEETTEKNFIDYLSNVVKTRKNEMEELIKIEEAKKD